MRLTFIIFTLFLLPNTVFFAQTEHIDSILIEKKAAKKTHSLKILSWNMYLLPAKTFMRTAQKARAELIAQQFNESDYDVLVLQEAFHKKARQILAKALKEKYPYQIGPANKGGFIKTNSGLWIVSKYPLEFVAQTKYEECFGVDCFAKKGALLVEVTKDGKTFQIADTHLQAEGGEKPDNIRISQVKQMTEKLIEAYEKEGVTQLLCGDFNIDINEANYKKMMTIVKADNTPTSGALQFTSSAPDYGTPSSVIDYILVRNQSDDDMTFTKEIKLFSRAWQWKGEKREHLSDHIAVEMLIEW